MPEGMLSEIPEGYQALAWWTYLGTFTGSVSALHLAPLDQGDRPYLTLCKRRPNRRYGKPLYRGRALTECEATCAHCIAVAGKEMESR